MGVVKGYVKQREVIQQRPQRELEILLRFILFYLVAISDGRARVNEPRNQLIFFADLVEERKTRSDEAVRAVPTLKKA